MQRKARTHVSSVVIKNDGSDDDWSVKRYFRHFLQPFKLTKFRLKQAIFGALKILCILTCFWTRKVVANANSAKCDTLSVANTLTAPNQNLSTLGNFVICWNFDIKFSSGFSSKKVWVLAITNQCYKNRFAATDHMAQLRHECTRMLQDDEATYGVDSCGANLLRTSNHKSSKFCINWRLDIANSKIRFTASTHWSQEPLLIDLFWRNTTVVKLRLNVGA